MQESLLYLLQVNAGIAAFYLMYRLLFRSLTFYRLNRFLLLFGILFSFAYPFLQLPQYFSHPAGLSADYGQILNLLSTAEVQQQEQQVLDWGYWLELLCWAGALFIFLRLLLRLFSLYSFHRLTSPANFKGYSFRKVALEVNPFSFWQTIYLNPACHEPRELEAILKHEQVHVAEFHTGDVLLAEGALLLCWFNPAMWLTKKAISENLEFITDQQLLQKGLDSKAYQYSLLKISQLSPASTLVNNFNFLTIKTRIAMMNKQKSTKKHLLAYVLMLPLASGLMWACSNSPEEGELVVPQQQVLTKAEAADQAIYYLDGQEVSKEVVNNYNQSNIKSVDVLKGEQAISAFGEKGQNGVVVVTTKANTDAEEVKALEEKINQGVTMRKVKGAEKGPELSEAYLMIDQQEASQADLKNLAPEKIESMEVLKGAEAVARFGEKAKKGAILIETKQ